jgi:hypothetical protein
LRNGAAWVRDLKSNREWQVTGNILEHDKKIDPTDHEFTPAWTHDGKRLLISVPNRIQIKRIGPPTGGNEENFKKEIQTWAIYRVPVDLAEQRELNNARVYGEEGHEFQLKPNDHPTGVVKEFDGILSTQNDIRSRPNNHRPAHPSLLRDEKVATRVSRA